MKPLLRTLRPIQAYKAAVIFSPALFHGGGSLWMHLDRLLPLAGFWCLASCLVYVLNDLLDLREDQARPERSHRPIASGEVSRAEALGLAGALLAGLCVTAWFVHPRAVLWVGLYLMLNLAYSAGLKRETALRSGIVAIGFFLRLKTGADPVLPIPLTPWASIFTLGLAYYLNSLKGLTEAAEERPQWLAAGLSGALTLVALTTLCIHRGVAGTLAHPELPPLLCLMSLHRVAWKTLKGDGRREQSLAFFKDWVTLGCLVATVVLLAA